MKRITNIFLIIFICFFIGASTTEIYAQDEQNVSIKIETDKKEYSTNDDISYKITLHNKSERSVDNVAVRLNLPTDVVITDTDGRISTKYVLWEHRTLDINETIILIAKGNIQKGYISPSTETEPPIKTPTVNIENETKDPNHTDSYNKQSTKSEAIKTKKDTNQINTSDNNKLENYLLLLILSGMIILVVFKLDKKKKSIKILMIFSLSGATIFSTVHISAKEDSVLQYKIHTEIENIINGERVLTEAEATMDVIKNENAIININNEKNENDTIVTYDDEISIHGTATDQDGIYKIMYKIYKNGQIYDSGTAKGTNNWSFLAKPAIGDSEIRIYCIDKKGNNTHTAFRLHRYSEEIILKNNVLIPEDEVVSNLSDSIIDIYENNDALYIVFDKSKLNTQTSSLLQKDSILSIEPCDAFLSGITLKVSDISEPSKISFGDDYIYPSGIQSYTDSSHIIAIMRTPTFPELFKSDVSVNLNDAKVDTENPIAFAIGGNGEPLIYEKRQKNRYTLKSNESKKKIDISALMPEIEIDKNSFLLKAENRVFYDADGDAKTKNDQIIYSGKFGIDNLELSGGVDWTLSDFDLFPKQFKTDIDYDFIKQMGFTYEGEMDLKDIVKEANKELNGGFENKKSFLGFNIQGIDLDTQIYLGSVGVRLAPAFTTVTGNLQDISNQSLIPVVVFSFVMDIEGNIYAKASITYDDSSHTKLGMNVQRDGYTGQMGTQAENRGQIHTDALGYSLDLYSKNGKSAEHMDIEPDAEFSLKADGHVSTKIGLGGNAGLMIFGIMPASMGLSIDAEGEAQGKLDATFYDKKDPIFQLSGSYSVEVLMNFNYAIKIMCNFGENGNPFGINEKGSNPIWSIVKMTSDDYKPKEGQGAISGTIIDKDSKKPIVNSYIELVDTEGKIKKHVSTNEKGEFSLSADAGTYYLDMTKAGYINPHKEITIEKNNTKSIDNIELERMKSGFYGLVVDENNTALSDVSISISDESGKEVKNIHTTSEGVFNDSLPVGTYKLKFHKDRYGYVTKDVILSGNVIKVADIHMKKVMFASGEGTTDNPYEITNEQQFNGIRDYPEASYKLTANLDFTSFGKWTPIGNEKMPFSGSIDGQGHKIANLTLTNEENLNGILGTVIIQDSQEIKDITFENISNDGIAKEEKRIGIIIASIEGKNNGSMYFKNVNVKNGNLITASSQENSYGGFISYCNLKDNSGISFINCTFNGSIDGTSSMGHVFSGGYIGEVIMKDNTSLDFINCSESGDISSSHSTSAYSGGFIGTCTGEGDFSQKIRIENSRSTGNINSINYWSSGSAGSGGLIGSLTNMNKAYVENVSHNGNINTKARITGSGGLIGNITFYSSNNEINIKNSFHNGRIDATGLNGDTLGGGCVGRFEGGGSGRINIENSYFSGYMDAILRGGILGAFLNSKVVVNIKNSYFSHELMGLKKTALCGTSTFYNPNKDLLHITNSYGLSSEDLKKQQSYNTWDFINIWDINDNVNEGMPYLR